ncbi:erythromycin esterase family protein [Clostridium sp. JS66]|uniref:erythromycin esterase family protein n=1 Tax=Clostridium sp. JS66 TaxID=3064705 RepID=UPI00298E91E2|nr:erythromycin esterase family protein [Clostridium sp. JS66]WPC44138.1 erythromycin esterase family protein [Clostridium sp. JS66]
MGYRVFAIEAESGGTQIVSDYVLNGIGNAEDAVKSMKFSVWSTKEVTDMVEWIRMYNKNPEHKEKIKFYGFDMQSSSENSTRILDYIKKVDNNNLSQFKEKLSCVYDQMPSLSNEKLNDVNKDTEELKNIFEKTGIPLSFIDFKSASENKNVGEWLSQKQLIHSVEDGYNGNIEQWMIPEVPIESYDGLIFVSKTSAAVGIKGFEIIAFINNWLRSNF